MPMSRMEPILSLNAKTEISRAVLKDAFSKFIRPALIWNADRDTNVLLDLVGKTVEEMELRLPPALFIDHGDHFPETQKMVDEISKEKNFRVLTVKNQNVLDSVKDEKIIVSDLNDANRNALNKAGFDGNEISYTLDNPLVYHLLCLLPLYEVLTKYRFDSIIATDFLEPGSESSSVLFMQSHENPDHITIDPIITFTRPDRWKYTFENELPVHSKYKDGYASVSFTRGNNPKTEKPAWENEMEKSEDTSMTSEDKERMIEKLRALGYL